MVVRSLLILFLFCGVTIQEANVTKADTNFTLKAINVRTENTDEMKPRAAADSITDATKKTDSTLNTDETQATNVTTSKDGIFEETNVPTTASTENALGGNNTTSATETDERPNNTRILVPCRNETEFTCNDGGCIDSEGKCNGLVECLDGSDEYRDTCRNISESARQERSIFALLLYCTSFWTELHNKTCPVICKHEPEFCYYALLADNGEPNLCVFPNYFNNSVYYVEPLTTGLPEKPDFRLRFNCTYTYVLVERARLGCVEGTWQNETAERYCSEACEIKKRENFIYSCPEDTNSDSAQCADFVAINTAIKVKRLDPPTNENGTMDVTVSIGCMPNKKFNITTDCVGVIEEFQGNFEKPTMANLTEYEGKFNDIKNNQTTYDTVFQNLVNDFHAFDKRVRNTLATMNLKAEECDIYLDLLILDLEEQEEIRNRENANNTTEPLLPNIDNDNSTAISS